MRWLIVFLLASLVFSGLRGWLQKIGLGRLPGDFHFRLRGREYYLPLASSLVLSLLAIGGLVLLYVPAIILVMTFVDRRAGSFGVALARDYGQLAPCTLMAWIATRHAPPIAICTSPSSMPR